MPLPIKACIFDLDGVIVDTARFHYVSWKEIAAKLGITFSKDDNEKLKGISRVESMRRICALGNLTMSDTEQNKWARKKNDHYIALVEKMTQRDILPGVTEFIDSLEKRKIKIALGSASKNARLVLQRVGLTSRFAAIIDGNDVTNSKPHPDVFLAAAECLNEEPQCCIVFEDAQAGIDAALCAQMYAIAVDPDQQLENAHRRIAGFKNLSFETLESSLNTLLS